jgi:hypothetical protein
MQPKLQGFPERRKVRHCGTQDFFRGTTHMRG